MPIAQRGALVAGTAFITAASTKIGMSVGTAIVKNSDLLKNYSSPTSDETPSPDSSFINCVLEKGDCPNISPLEELLTYQLTLGVLILALMVIFLYIIFIRFILPYSFNFILSFIKNFDKYMSNNAKNNITCQNESKSNSSAISNATNWIKNT